MGVWLPLLEYARVKGVSLSTLRRYIKARRVNFKTENGRYLIYVDDLTKPAYQAAGIPNELSDLQIQLQRANEEIAELKMLVALYEETQSAPQLST